MEINSTRIREIADIIEAYPELHDQDRWLSTTDPDRTVTTTNGRRVHCGTSQCIAGWAVVLDYDEHNRLYDGARSIAEVSDQLLDGSEKITFKGDRRGMIDIGAELLGLEASDAYQLFMTTDNDRNWPVVLRRIADGEDVDQVLEDTYREGPEEEW